MWRCYEIAAEERGLRLVQGRLVEVLGPGKHWRFDWPERTEVAVVSSRDVWLERDDLPMLARSDARPAELLVLEVLDDELAFVWIDGRFARRLERGWYGLWTASRAVIVEVVERALAPTEWSPSPPGSSPPGRSQRVNRRLA